MARWIAPWFSMDDELDHFFGDPFQGNNKWMTCPVVDVYEKDGKIIVKFELPGVHEDDIDVEITDKVVLVKGETKDKKEVKDKKYYRMESKMSSFSRQIAWPATVDYKKAEALMHDGILEISAPKVEQEKLTTKLKVKKIADKK